MRLPSVPGPRDLLTLVDRGGETLEQLLAALPRVVPLVEATGRLLGRLDRLLTEVERRVADVDRLADEVDRLVGRIENTRQAAAAEVARVDEPISRLQALLDMVEPPLLQLKPVLDRLAAATGPQEADSAVWLLDQLPPLVARVQHDALPVVEQLRSVAPDMHDLVEVSRELNDMLGKLPGMGRIRRKVDEETEDEDS